MPMLWRFLGVAGLTALCWPAAAHAIPFFLVASGGSLLPLLGLLLAALFASRRGLAFMALLVVAWMLAFPARAPVTYQSYMRTEARIRETLAAEQRLIEALHLRPAGPAQALTAQDLQDKRAGGAVVWVSPLEQPLLAQTSLAQIARDPSRHAPDTVFVSDGSGWRAAYAAALTGARWLQGGIASMASQAQPYQGPVHDALPDCASGQCLRIGVHLGFQAIWSSFGRNDVDANLRIEQALVAPADMIARLSALTKQWRIPAVLVFFGSSGEEENRLWTGFLQELGLQNATMLRAYEEPSESDPGLAEWMQAIVGTYRPEILPSELAGVCGSGADAVLVSSQTPVWEQVTHYPDSLDACPRFNLPVEGLLPDEVAAYVAGQADALTPLRSKRLIGLYLDGPNLFYASQLRDIMQRQGYAWTGIVFGYNTGADGLSPLRAAFDVVLGAAYRAYPGEGRQIPVVPLAGAGFFLLLFAAAVFVWARSRPLSLAAFAGFVLLAAMMQHVFYRYPLAGWLDPLWVVFAAAVLALVMAQCRHRWLARPLDKARGLALLRRLRLPVPRSLVLRSSRTRVLHRAVRKLGCPLIFRSNELTSENRSVAAMGQHESVVVRHADDLPGVGQAWARMAATPGARPAWLVQPFLPLERSGVIRTGLVRDGCACLRIESSATPEGVTGNQAAQVTSRVLDVEACRVADEPLLRQAARIVDATQGRPGLLEFGLRQGEPVWLQYQPLPADALLCHGDAQEQGYALSPMHAEMRDGKGAPLLLSLMNASIPFRRWCMQAGQVMERAQPSQPLFAVLAACLPWALLLRLSAWSCRWAGKRWRQGRGDGVGMARCLLLLNALVCLKGRARMVVRDDAGCAEPAFAAIDSPYAVFHELGGLTPLAPQEPASASGGQGRRCTASFVVRERLRTAITYALCLLSRKVDLTLQARGAGEQAWDRLTLADLRRAGRPLPNPAFMPEAPVPGRRLDGPRVRIDDPAAVPQVLLALADAQDAVVAARYAWIGLFALSSHVGRFEIDAPVHANSHFYQRARLLGIEVVSGRAAAAGEGPADDQS